MSSKVLLNKRTKEVFIEKAIAKHGNRFDYSNVDYKTCKDKVIIICKMDGHGEFENTPDSHLSIRSQGGCPICRYATIASKRKKPQETFIAQVKEIHGKTYDYSEVIYVNHTTPVKIKCKIHGIFEQRAGNHLRGDGCIKCAGIYTPTTVEWIGKAKEKHGTDKFDYEKVIYVNANTEVIIGCKTCGNDFKQTPTSHMYSEIGCDWCRKKHAYTTAEFIEEAKKIHADKFDYSKTEYKSAREPVIIICKIHGEFTQTPSDHKNQGSGCRKCSNVYSPSTEEWITWAKSVWDEEYNYSKVDYKSASEKVIIECKKHGDFECSPNNHIHSTNPTGCPSCVRKGEGLVAEFLKSKYTDYIKEWRADFLDGKRMDFMLPSHRICIEVDGLQHFRQVRDWKSPEEQRRNDIEKMKLCIDNGYSIIRIYQPIITIVKNDWKVFIENAIKLISESTTLTIVFSGNTEYDNYSNDCNIYHLKYSRIN